MPLVANLETKGLWLPESPRKAGVHALIIGVSEYPHLSGGSLPVLAKENGGLGQLEVSAKTAARIFSWLDQAGEIAGAPIATCRLHLSPRTRPRPEALPNEIVEKEEVDLLTFGKYGPADFESVRKAIKDWGKDIFAGAAAGLDNVAFFFFSGHGTEYMASPALLMSDILNPGSPDGAHNAVAFMSICQAIKTYGIDRALCFVDACRDVPGVARTLNIIGEDVLQPLAYPPRNHEALICLHSTRAGGSAYQVPGERATIFGQAVIDGLDGPPPNYEPYDKKQVPWRLVFKDLECHVKQKVRELLARQTATLIQSVVPYGDPYDGEMVVARKIKGPATGVPRASEDGSVETRSADIFKGFAQGLDVAGVDAAVSGSPHRGRVTSPLNDLEVMDGIFGHRGITNPWIRTLRIVDASTEQPIPDAVRLAKGRSEHVSATVTAWVDILVMPAPGRAVWISAGGEDGCPFLAVVIPRDLNGQIPVRLDAAFEKRPSGRWSMSAMSARLCDPAGLAVDPVWGHLWEIQRTELLSSLSGAGMKARDLVQPLVMALANKQVSPVSAAIAATFLIRCGNLDDLHDWPRNLANMFPEGADGAVLWAETLIRREDRMNLEHRAVGDPGETPPLRNDAAEVLRLISKQGYDEARQYFAELARRGAPLLASTLVMAVRQEKFFRAVIEAHAVSGEALLGLGRACEVVRNASGSAVGEGLFAGFASPDRLSPRQVLGLP